MRACRLATNLRPTYTLWRSRSSPLCLLLREQGDTCAAARVELKDRVLEVAEEVHDIRRILPRSGRTVEFDQSFVRVVLVLVNGLLVDKWRLWQRDSPRVRRQWDDTACMNTHVRGGPLDVVASIRDEFRVVRAQVNLREANGGTTNAHGK